jgi:hypothetical protein
MKDKFILFGIFCFFGFLISYLIFNEAKASDGFQKNQMIYVQYICFNEDAIMELTEADVEEELKSITTAKFLVSLGQCAFIREGIKLRILDVLLDYKDYNNDQIQVLQTQVESGKTVYTAAYKKLSSKMPYFKNKPKEIKI